MVLLICIVIPFPVMGVAISNDVSGGVATLVAMISCSSLCFALWSIQIMFTLFWRAVHIDEEGLQVVSVLKKPVEVSWSNIATAEMQGRRKKKNTLFISTFDGSEVIPLNPFDTKAIWQTIEPLITSTPEEREKREASALRAKKQLHDEVESLIADQPLRVTANRHSWIYGVATIFVFLPMAIHLLFVDGELFFALGAVGLGVYSAHEAWSLYSVISMDSEQISSKQRFVSAKKIRWTEIKEIHESEHDLLFRGHHKQLFISAPKSWSGSDKEQMQRWIAMQVEKHAIKKPIL